MKEIWRKYEYFRRIFSTEKGKIRIKGGNFVAAMWKHWCKVLHEASLELTEDILWKQEQFDEKVRKVAEVLTFTNITGNPATCYRKKMLFKKTIINLWNAFLTTYEVDDIWTRWTSTINLNIFETNYNCELRAEKHCSEWMIYNFDEKKNEMKSLRRKKVYCDNWHECRLNSEFSWQPNDGSNST